jgi:hypothetical protein
MIRGGKPSGELRSQGNFMTIDTGEAAIRTVIAGAIVESYDASGSAVSALLAMRQAEAIVKALAIA